MEDFRTAAAALTLAQCVDDADLFVEVKTLLLVCAEILLIRHKYLDVAPWNFSRADTREGARAFLDSANSRPLDEQDDLTRYFSMKSTVSP